METDKTDPAMVAAQMRLDARRHQHRFNFRLMVLLGSSGIMFLVAGGIFLTFMFREQQDQEAVQDASEFLLSQGRANALPTYCFRRPATGQYTCRAIPINVTCHPMQVTDTSVDSGRCQWQSQEGSSVSP